VDRKGRAAGAVDPAGVPPERDEAVADEEAGVAVDDGDDGERTRTRLRGQRTQRRRRRDVRRPGRRGCNVLRAAATGERERGKDR